MTEGNKLAEEWRNSLNYEIDNDTFYNIVIPCIEFGYNKAKEELEEFIVSHRKERDYVFDAWHKQIEYVKTIIQDLLSNSDKYARQRAIDFLKEKEPKSRDNRNNYQDKSTPCYYSRKGENNYQYSSMGIIDSENYDYISVRQYHERYEDTE